MGIPMRGWQLRTSCCKHFQQIEDKVLLSWKEGMGSILQSPYIHALSKLTATSSHPAWCPLPSLPWFITHYIVPSTNLFIIVTYVSLVMRYTQWWLEGQEEAIGTKQGRSLQLIVSFSKLINAYILEDAKHNYYSLFLICNLSIWRTIFRFHRHVLLRALK